MGNKLSDKHINWLNFGTFRGNCLFVCGFTYDETIKVLKRKKSYEWLAAFETTADMWESDNWGFASRREVMGKDYFFLIIKSRFDFKDKSVIYLAHEVVHLASFHLRDILDPMQENECFAYTHTHLMEQVYKILRN